MDDDLRTLLRGTRYAFDHLPTAEEALDVLLELHGLHELDVSVAEALVAVARDELVELRAQAHLVQAAVREQHVPGVLRCPACHVGTLWSDEEGVRCVIPAGPDAPHLMVNGCGHGWDSVGFPVDTPDTAPAPVAATKLLGLGEDTVRDDELRELANAYADSLGRILDQLSPQGRAAYERLRGAVRDIPGPWGTTVPAVAATVAVPIAAGRAAWEWMNATGEHHGSDLMPLRTVLDNHPLIGGCRNCHHGSDEHEPARFGGCFCDCTDWIDPHPEEN